MHERAHCARGAYCAPLDKWGWGQCTECPNACSGHGACSQDGTCGCDEGYRGDDCSKADYTTMISIMAALGGVVVLALVWVVYRGLKYVYRAVKAKTILEAERRERCKRAVNLAMTMQ